MESFPEWLTPNNKRKFILIYLSDAIQDIRKQLYRFVLLHNNKHNWFKFKKVFEKQEIFHPKLKNQIMNILKKELIQLGWIVEPTYHDRMAWYIKTSELQQSYNVVKHEEIIGEEYENNNSEYNPNLEYNELTSEKKENNDIILNIKLFNPFDTKPIIEDISLENFVN